MIRVFLKNTKNDFEAIGEYNIDTNELKVLKNSRVSLNISQAWTFDPKSVIKARQGKLEKDILKEDILFKSPSSAANFITGKNTDGLTAWKNESGESIKSLRNKENNND